MNINFKQDIVQPATLTATLLPEEPFGKILPEYAASIIGKACGSVTLEVEPNDPYWTPELAKTMRLQVQSLRDDTGAPGVLEVVYV